MGEERRETRKTGARRLCGNPRRGKAHRSRDRCGDKLTGRAGAGGGGGRLQRSRRPSVPDHGSGRGKGEQRTPAVVQLRHRRVAPV